MARHFIHYIKRRIYTRPHGNGNEWFAIPQKLGAGFSKPRFHLTRQKNGAVKEIRPGDIIWLVSQLDSPWGKLPPALDAKIVVDRIRQEKGCHKFIAGNGSVWLALCDCTQLLMQLQTRSAKGISALLTDAAIPVGIYLQSMREVVSASVLLRWVQHMQQKPLQFISYRLADGTAAAFHTVNNLLAKKLVVFWDRWCLPRRLAERREQTSGFALNKHILAVIKNCSRVWGIESKGYAAAKSYSRKEYLLAKKLKKYHRVNPIKEKQFNK